MTVKYTPIDIALSKAVSLRFANQSITIEFQFPPKIISDGRKGNWNENDYPGTEPVAAYQTSGAREISLNFTYVVDGGKWTTSKVAQQISNLRGYFARYRQQPGFRGLVVFFKMWNHGPRQLIGGDVAQKKSEEMSCRLKSVDVKHSDTIIVPNGNVDLAYALRSDVTVELRIWTKGGPQETQDLPGLKQEVTPDWY
jgi:hypothetical protein